MNQRIAIVGTGIAGLTAAWLLQRRHEITVFERDRRIGGHSHTVTVAADAGELGVDTGFIVYNRRTYPNFARMLDILGVATQPSDMSFSFRDAATGQEYGAPEPWRLLAQPGNLLRGSFRRMLRDILRFYREAPAWLERADEGTVLEQFLTERGYSQDFVENHLYPVCAAIWSSPHAGMGRYPAAALFRFFANHGLLSLTDRPQWRTVTGGSHRYVESLTAAFRDRIRTGTPVTSVERDEDGITIRTPEGGPERFDQVVLACHADQALAVLATPTARETEVLGAFPYAANETVLHSDTRIMPRRRLAWASWNYHRSAGGDRAVTVTYDQNRLQRLRSRRRWLVTLNRTADLDPALVHARLTYEHPQYDARAVRLQGAVDELNGTNRTWYCGAYWGYGFHEDGVVSGLRVARAFGEELEP
ncbi:MAG: FAD-dependent oxidoreductase [Krumholzibacteria bacterium]|nr:FAD-dependent oxidoreductase [Candidatus Krumholzibacteria bacterium]